MLYRRENIIELRASRGTKGSHIHLSPISLSVNSEKRFLKTRTAPQTPISHSLVLTEVPYMKDVKECWGTNEVMRK